MNAESQDLRPVLGHLSAHRWSNWVTAHGFSSIFLYACSDRDMIPESVRLQWEKLQIQLMFKNIGFFKTADMLFGELENAGIKAVAMRGVTLLYKIYADPCIRVMGDVDILINPQDHEMLRTYLAERNFIPKAIHRSQYVYKFGTSNVEIHWSLITARRYRERMDTSEFISTRQPLEVKDGRIFCLTPENELIGLITHAVIHHELTILKQLFDIALYLPMPGIDWHYIATWCRNAQMTRMFVFTIQLTGRLFELDVSNILGHFYIQLPKSWGKIIDAYIDAFFTVDMSQLFARKRNAIYMAEGPLKKLEQFFTMFSMSEAKDIYKRYFEIDHKEITN